MIVYKALTKRQVAIDADVSINVVRRWCKQLEEQMIPYGYTKQTKLLNPACVRILSEFFAFTPHNAVVI